MSAETQCRVTNLFDRIRCTQPAGHDGQHAGGGWVWWHGNGEDCAPGCSTCARIAPPAETGDAS